MQNNISIIFDELFNNLAILESLTSNNKNNYTIDSIRTNIAQLYEILENNTKTIETLKDKLKNYKNEIDYLLDNE